MRFSEQREIESISFSARTNIASDLNTFLAVITTDAAVKSLQDRLHNDPSLIDHLVKVMRHLIGLEFDAKYENPCDSAVATYGWIITKVNPACEGLVADLLLSLQHSWWSRQLAVRYQPNDRN